MKINWKRPKQFVLDQNNLDSPKPFWPHRRKRYYCSKNLLPFQYCSIVKKMNVLGCNDQFFNIFLNILAFILSFIIGFLNNEVPGKMGINYYMCTGEDPRDFKDLGSKVKYNSQLKISFSSKCSSLLSLFFLTKKRKCS